MSFRIGACDNKKIMDELEKQSHNLDTPVSNYASFPANNYLKSRLVLSCARKYSKCVAQLSTSLDFKLLFAGTEA